MTGSPTFDDVFAVMSAASVGEADARVPLPAEPQLDDIATRFAIALNLLLDDLALRTDQLRRTEEQLRHAQKMEAIGRLAGGIAHDFNNLLSIILSYSSMAIPELQASDPLRSDLEEIKKAGDRAAMLTRQLLAFSRQQVTEPRILDLNDTISSMDGMIRRIIGEDVELKTVTGTDLGKVKIDPGHIEQVVMNLVVNARDAMPRGGRLTIETGNMELDDAYAKTHVGVAAGPHVMLAVSDTGFGMDKSIQERVFEPFFTTKEQGKGTGLGLATVFGIVKQAGGNIWLYSEPGKGTTFKIYLPRTDEIMDRVPTPVLVRSLEGTETLVVVEDEPAVRAVVCGILEKHGYRVLGASGARDAVAICKKHAGQIDLILTDVVMPEMSGRELVEHSLKLRPDMGVLYMSGYTENSIVHHGVLDPGIVLLQKPITPDALLRKVREVLDTRR